MTYGMRRKGTEAIIGIVPPKIHAISPHEERGAAYLRDFEEVPLYTGEQLAALLAKSAQHDELVARVASAPVGTFRFDHLSDAMAVGTVTEEFSGDDATFRKWSWTELEHNARVRLVLEDSDA